MEIREILSSTVMFAAFVIAVAAAAPVVLLGLGFRLGSRQGVGLVVDGFQHRRRDRVSRWTVCRGDGAHVVVSGETRIISECLGVSYLHQVFSEKLGVQAGE
jgi:hypothetical protein